MIFPNESPALCCSWLSVFDDMKHDIYERMVVLDGGCFFHLCLAYLVVFFLSRHGLSRSLSAPNSLGPFGPTLLSSHYG